MESMDGFDSRREIGCSDCRYMKWSGVLDVTV
jgi:hypothetical protein